MHSSPLRRFLLILFACGTTSALAIAQQPRVRITRADELPALTYAAPEPAEDLVVKEELFRPFAARLRSDIEKLLRDFEIEDVPTLARLQSALIDLDLLEGRFDIALAGIARLRALDERERAYDQPGLFTEALATVGSASSSDPEAHREALNAAMRTLLARQDWKIAGAEIKRDMGFFTFMTEGMALTMVKRALGGEAKANEGRLRLDMAIIAVAQRSLITLILPNRAAFKDAYLAEIEKHKPADGAEGTSPRSFWGERALALTATDKLTSIVVAVWDTGVDIEAFQGRLWTNPAEKANGLDNDGNGFPSDVHGIGLLNDVEPTSDLLPRLTEGGQRIVAEFLAAKIGSADLRAGRDTPAAAAFQKRMEAQANLTAEQVEADRKAGELFFGYVHGTHVAGIALEGNPAAQLMVLARIFDLERIRVPPTTDWSRQVAVRFRLIAAYLAANRVRVVNMSFGEDPQSFASLLRQHGVGESDDWRLKEAQASFVIYREALVDLIKSSPDVLFVCSAGNSADDADFTGRVPQSLVLDNLLCVGAADASGLAARNSSFGPRVWLYAPGVDIESSIPGGHRIALSGTSQATPQVSNLVAKILAVNPALKVHDVISLLRAGATPSGAGKFSLIHPQQTIALARESLTSGR